MPDPKYQFGVSHQSLVWLEKHQADKKMMIEKKKEKKTTNVLVGLRIAQQSDALSSVLPLVLPAGSF